MSFEECIKEINDKYERISNQAVDGGYSQVYIDAIDNKLHIVDTIADLKAYTGSAQRIYVTGYHTKDDGAFGSNVFKFIGEVADASEDNGGTVQVIQNGTKYYKYELQYDGAICDSWFGGLGTNLLTDRDVVKKMKMGETVKIVCLGDSITFGKEDTSNNQSNVTYPSHLQKNLRAFYKNVNIVVVNKGVSGNTSGDMLSRIKTDVLDLSPDLVIFNAGTNDSRSVKNIDIHTYRENIIKIFKKMAHIPVIVMGITPRFKKDDITGVGEGVIDMYRKELKKQADFFNLTYIDTFSELYDIYKNRADARYYLSQDGSHYSELGYALIANIVFKTMINDDISIKVGEFKSADGQWISAPTSSISYGVQNCIDEDSIIIKGDDVYLYLYLTDFSDSYLVIHAVADNSVELGQYIDVENLSLSIANETRYNLSPKKPSTSFYFIDYPIPTSKLVYGLNVIKLKNTTTSARISGFSVKKNTTSFYMARTNRNNNDSFDAIRYPFLKYGFKSNSDRYVVDVVDQDAAINVGLIDPSPRGEITRYRIRATVSGHTRFTLGQTANTLFNYRSAYDIIINTDTVAIFAVNPTEDSKVSLASNPITLVAGGTDIVIDITTQSSGWSIWIDSVLLYTDDIPLSISPVFFTREGGGSSVVNIVSSFFEKPINATDTGQIVGEMWETFSDNKLHITDKNKVEKTISYT